MEFLKANGIEDHSFVKEMDYQEVLNSQEIFGEELKMFAKKELQKEVRFDKSVRTTHPPPALCLYIGRRHSRPTRPPDSAAHHFSACKKTQNDLSSSAFSISDFFESLKCYLLKLFSD